MGLYVKVDIDVNASCWVSIDKYFTQLGSIFLHW